MKLNVPDDYIVGDGEANNLVYLILKYTIDWQMRECDLQVMLMMQERPITGTEGIKKLISDTCDYAWDHISGEPDEFSPEDLIKHITPAIENWYANSTPEERQNTA